MVVRHEVTSGRHTSYVLICTGATYTGSTYSVPCSSQPRQPYTHATGGRIGRAMFACKHVRKEVKCGAEVASSGRYVISQVAEIVVPGQMSSTIPSLTA